MEKPGNDEIISHLYTKANDELIKFHNMRENLTTKSSYLLGFLGVMFGLYANIIVNMDLSIFYNSNDVYGVILTYLLYSIAIIISASFIVSILLILKIFFPKIKYAGVDTLNIYEDYLKENKTLTDIKEGSLRNVIVGLELENLIKAIGNRDFKNSLLFTIYGIGASMILFMTYLSVITFPLYVTHAHILISIFMIILLSVLVFIRFILINNTTTKEIESQGSKVLILNDEYNGGLDSKTIDKIIDISGITKEAVDKMIEDKKKPAYKAKIVEDYEKTVASNVKKNEKSEDRKNE